jgi:hypothetical protein
MPCADGSRLAKPLRRFGIGEWYGRSFVSLPPSIRQHYAEIQFAENPTIPACPFLSRENSHVPCWKEGGVCSLRLYERALDGKVLPASDAGTLRCTCPSRFEQNSAIYDWIGETLLGNSTAVPIGQVNFLERMPLMRNRPNPGEEQIKAEEVGRIDNVLIVPNSEPLLWCPVEIQAVYFSGRRMELEFESLRAEVAPEIPFPAAHRRPDYRSSGPKRLMPQLLVKVPTLRRWGKKMAVVIDEDFFAELGRMDRVPDISNCDVAWFIVRFEENRDAFTVQRKEVFLTTLESSQSGLVAAKPVSKEQFERRIRTKLSIRNVPNQVSSKRGVRS